MQHVIETEEPLRMHHCRGQCQITAECFGRMLPVNMKEAHRPVPELCPQVIWCHRTAVSLPRDHTLIRHAMAGAMAGKQGFHLVIGPVERIDAQRLLAIGQGQGQGDEIASLERADLGDGPAHAMPVLMLQQPGANCRREA